MKENVHANHRSRVRKRYIENGLEGFADHEVLELLLYYCYPRQDTNEIAHKMINEFGKLTNLFDADVQTIMNRCQTTEKIAVLINLIPKLANLYFRSKWGEKIVLNSHKVAGEYAISLFVGKNVEVFYLLCLDTQLRLNHVSVISEGTLNEAAVYPREIASEAFKHQAASIIVAHNHPGGSTKPSRPDIETTRKLVEGLAFIKLPVVDHIIVAGDQYYSFAMRGQLVEGY